MFFNYQNDLAASIVSIENQITELQIKLSEVQAHQQATRSVEQAAVSAMEQVRSALALIQNITPELQEEFRSELNGLFDHHYELPGEPEPQADSEAIEVTAIEVQIPMDESTIATLSDEQAIALARREGLISKGRPSGSVARSKLRGMIQSHFKAA